MYSTFNITDYKENFYTTIEKSLFSPNTILLAHWKFPETVVTPAAVDIPELNADDSTWYILSYKSNLSEFETDVILKNVESLFEITSELKVSHSESKFNRLASIVLLLPM